MLDKDCCCVRAVGDQSDRQSFPTRRSSDLIPVMMLTAKRELVDKEKAYLAGTDDYVIKPFEPKEVIFRIKALLRRFQMISEEVITIGQVAINRKSFAVEFNGKTVVLPLKEFEL